MIRWWIFLAITLGVLAVSGSTVIGLSRTTETMVDRVRQSRMRHQALEQQLITLKSPHYEHLAAGLEQDLASLQIDMAEVMSSETQSPDVIELSYEQNVLAHRLDTTQGQPVTTLRLMLSVKIQHAAGLLALLRRIDQRLTVWPHEVRGCDIHRVRLVGLQANCVVDFYHWSHVDRIGASPEPNRTVHARV